MYSGRTPETYYFSHGYVSFSKMPIDHSIDYAIWVYTDEGMTLSLLESGHLKDEAHLKQLLAIQDLGSVSQ